MTDIALLPAEGQVSRPEPSVKPTWLRPAAISVVVACHLTVAWLLMAVALPTISALDSISMELVPEGDFFEAEEVSAAEDQPPPPEEVQEVEAIPPPEVMSPEAPPLPVAKKEVVEAKKKVVERKPTTDYAKQRREAQARRRMGAPDGQSQATGVSKAAYQALLAAAIRRHTPGSTSLGEGAASCTFHVTSGGGMSGISCSGGGGHAALARRILASVHAPPPPGGGFYASQSFHFH
jgi:protein TonB